MQKDRGVLSLLSDSGTDYDLMMARDFPKQCFNFGISEQNKVAAASGMAKMGKTPFVYTTGSFLAYRAYEFIRDDICFQRRNVKLMGMGMGMGMGAWSTLGASHHTTEDIAALRALPNLTLISAATPLELARCVWAAYETDGPVYVRLGMSGEEELYDETYEFKLGKPVTLSEGHDIAIFSTGTITAETVHAAERLRVDGVSVKVLNVHTLKPLDKDDLIAAVNGLSKVFTVEEHNINGGLGGAIAEVLAGAGIGIPLMRIGLNDSFAKGYGTTAEVRKLNGLDREGIYAQIKQNLN
jgi:transketolase